MKIITTALSVYALGTAISFAVAGMIKVIDQMIRTVEARAKNSD